MENKKVNLFISWCNKNSNKMIVAIILGVLILGMAYVSHLGARIRFWDEEHYLFIVHHLKAGMYSFDGIESTAFQPPGYPITLFLISFLNSSFGFLRYANFIFFAVALWCTYKILIKNVSSLAAVLGVAVAALYPLFYYTSGAFYPQMLGAALMLCCFCLVDRLKEPWTSMEFLLGCIYGWLVLVIPLYIFYLPCLAAYPWILKRSKKLRAVSLLVFGASVVIGCWTVRNAMTFHDFIPISTNDGVNILLGNNENMTPNIGVNADIREYQHAARNMSDIEKDAYYRKIAFQWISNNPEKALKNYFLKALNFFGYTNKLAQQSEQTPVRDFVLFITYYPLLLLAILRLCYICKYPLQGLEKLIVVFFIASPFIHALFFTRLRFRVPFDFLTIMLAASYVSYRMQGSAGHKI